MLADQHYQVKVNKKTVDGTYFKTSVPSTHTPNYSWEKGIQVRPLNDLPDIGSTSKPSGYTVVGAGKTGTESHLLGNQRNPTQNRDIFQYRIGAQPVVTCNT